MLKYLKFDNDLTLEFYSSKIAIVNNSNNKIFISNAEFEKMIKYYYEFKWRDIT